MAAKPPGPPKGSAKPKRAAKPTRPTKPTRPANLPYGRWLGDFEPLSKVERQLVEHCARGTFLTLGNERPEKPLAGTKIRAGLVRFLLLGGDEQSPAHELGVVISGAWIEGVLNLRHAHCKVGLNAWSCRFDDDVIAAEATIPALRLAGSSIRCLMADGLRVHGDVFLRGDFTATGEVRLLGAEIGGDLDCQNGTFSNDEGPAIGADRIKVRGTAFLNGRFTATGEVRLLGAEIGANLDCSGGTFSNEKGSALHADRIKVKGGVFLRDLAGTGEVRMLGGEIGGDLDCTCGNFANAEGTALHADKIKVKGSVIVAEGFTATGEVRLLGAEIGGDLICNGGTFASTNGDALSLQGADIRGALMLRDGSFAGEVDLATAYTGTLVDDQACYKNAELVLDGFRYDRIVGPTGASVRIDWLKHQRQAHLGGDFKPQPWEQLIRVLRDMGHPAEAAKIAMAKQQALRDAGQIGLRQPNPDFSGWRLTLDKAWTAFSNFLARHLHWFYGWIAGYGHRPARIVWRMALVCALCSLAYYKGREQGLIGPSNPVIHLNPKLARCGTGGDPGAIYWTSPDCPVPPEYSTFQPFFYSLDVLIPFVDLHQEADWGPVVTNERGQTLWGGRALRWILWFEIIFGWIASVMFVAIVGRLVDKD